MEQLVQFRKRKEHLAFVVDEFGELLGLITLETDLNTEQVLRFKEREGGLIGAQVDEELLRYYPYGTLAAHVLGYTQSITQEEFKILSEKGYEIRDHIGRTGVEAAYESHLRGKWGGEMLEVDAMGVVQRSLGVKPPIQGQDLHLRYKLLQIRL